MAFSFFFNKKKVEPSAPAPPKKPAEPYVPEDTPTIHQFMHTRNPSTVPTTKKVLGVYNVNGDIRRDDSNKEFGKEPPPKPEGAIRLVCISDTHEKEVPPEFLPDGDILVHGGDFTYTGKPGAVERFNAWLGTLPHKHKVVIAGNHDVTFHPEYYHSKWRRYHDQKFPSQATKNSLTNCIYLEDGEVTVEGVRIYGSPWQPEFCDWAFNLSGSEALKEKWDLIPTGIDVLITHGPPFGYGGICLPRKDDAGCYELLQAIKRTKPIVHVAGHIHEGYGAAMEDGVVYVNASSVNQKYILTNHAVVIDIA